jgi:hypothetical protein
MFITIDNILNRCSNTWPIPVKRNRYHKIQSLGPNSQSGWGDTTHRLMCCPVCPEIIKTHAEFVCRIRNRNTRDMRNVH